MIDANKIGPALHAVHRILVIARGLAAAGADPPKLYKVLDWAEVLPTLITPERPDDTTEEFREILAGLGAEFPEFAGVLSSFDAACGLYWPPDTAAARG
jgi:hypothetical protein